MGWDVGANMGQSVARMLAAGFSTVIAFEPADESYQVLSDAYRSDARVKTFQLAISDHTGMLELAVRAAPIMTGQLTAVDMPYRGEHAGEQGVANWGGETGTRELECKTLDQLCLALGMPQFVKVDTEGHEAQVLRGAKFLISVVRPRWMIEFHREDLHDECVSLLEAGGYAVETVRHPHYPPDSYMWHNHGWLRAAVEEASDGN